MNDNNIMPNAGINEYHPEIIKKYEFTCREAVMAYIAAALGYLTIKLFAAPLFTDGRMGLGTAVLLLALTAYGLFYSKINANFTLNKALRIALCISFSVNIFISSNITIQFLDAVFVVLVLAYDKLADSDKKFAHIRSFFPADMFGALAVLPFAEYGACGHALKYPAEKSSGGRNIKNALLGLAIAVPSTVVVGFLLMCADSGFEKIMDSILSDSFSKIIIFLIQLCIGIPAAFYFFGICRSCDKKLSCELINDEKTMEHIRSVRFLPSVAGVFSALPICFLYTVFFISQLGYFLSAFMNKLPSDMVSYSEYARRGFFELCFVSLINLAVIISLNLFCKDNSSGARPRSVKAMTCILSVFTLLLIITAVSKMVMYINIYGLTLLRVYTTWFMALLFIVFTGIILKLIIPKINLSKLTVTAFTVMFAALSFCNVDGLIAKYNISGYTSGSLEYFSVSMLGELSSGAAPEIKELMDSTSNSNEKENLEKIMHNMQKSEDIRTLTASDIILEKILSADE